MTAKTHVLYLYLIKKKRELEIACALKKIKNNFTTKMFDID